MPDGVMAPTHFRTFHFLLSYFRTFVLSYQNKATVHAQGIQQVLSHQKPSLFYRRMRLDIPGHLAGDILVSCCRAAS